MKEKKQNGRKGRAYLNDFVVSDDGKYIYQGITYSFDGDNSSKRRRYAYTAILSLIAFISTVVCGCIPAAGMDDCFYVLIPWALEAVSGIFLMVALFRILFAKEPIRSYVFAKSAAILPDRAIANAITPAICLISATVYLILNGFEDKVWGSVTYLLLNVVTAVLSYAVYRYAEKTEYKKIIPKSQDEEE